MQKTYVLYAAITLFSRLFVSSDRAHAQAISQCVASPHPITVTQANGSALTIVGKGTIYNAWTETTDGYTVIRKNGLYEYAQKINGKLVASGTVARNRNERRRADTDFLRNVPKSLMPEASANTDFSRFQPRSRTAASAKKPGYPSSGNVKALLLLIRFPDLKNKYPSSNFTNLMNQANYRGTGSFKDYFAASSNGKLTISTDVFGWYTAKHNHDYYGDQNGSISAIELVREAVNAAQAAGVDFSKYDNNGDGVADGVIVVHAGPGAEEGAQTEYIWSHRWALSANGNPVTYDGVVIDDYIVTPETREFTGGMVGRGIFCHEFGHLLNLPDLYDTDGSSEGTGEWSLMASAGWLGNEHTPGGMCAWTKAKLGWITPKVLTAAGNYTLNPASTSYQCYRINTSNANEYFLLENRRKTTLDGSLPGGGLAIWHINAATANGYPGSNTVNSDESRKGVDLEEADGKNDLDNLVNRGDAGDLFPGSAKNTSFTDAGKPAAKTYANQNTGIRVSNIAVDGSGNVSFTFGKPATATPTITSFSPVRGAAGSKVTLTGTNLSGATLVAFNGVSTTAFTVTNSTTLIVTVPANAKTGSIKVTTPASAATSRTAFTVTATASVTRPVVGSVTLINAATDKDAATLTNGMTINYATLGSSQINFRANTNPSNVGSVKFIMDGKTKIENRAPYTYAGDQTINGKLDYNAVTLATGAHTLQVIAYPGANATGIASNAYSVKFTVTRGTAQAVAASPVAEKISLQLTAYPNPFTERTTLEFTATESAPAQLALYDAIGNPVADVFAGKVESGEHYTFELDGRTLKSGLYVSRLRIGNQVVHQKIVLNK